MTIQQRRWQYNKNSPSAVDDIVAYYECCVNKVTNENELLPAHPQDILITLEC